MRGQIHSNMSNYGQIFATMTASSAGVVLTESHIQNPMELVLNTPMTAYSLSKASSNKRQTQQIVGSFKADLVTNLALGFNTANCS